MITPPNGPTTPPNGSTLIQIGFNSQLNYPFVAATLNSSAQILYYTPLGLMWALNTPEVMVQSIRPYDTTQTLGYMTTVVLSYIPTEMVNLLAHELTEHSARLFQQKNPSIRTLFSMINTAIPLLPGPSVGGSSAPGTVPPSSSSGLSGYGGGSGSSNDVGGAASSSSTISPKSAVIAASAAVGAAAYGAGMFFIARRYRRRRQLHHRSSSTVSEQMSEVSGGHLSTTRSRSAYGGANSRNSGRSNLTQLISAPVTSENSLGWN